MNNKEVPTVKGKGADGSYVHKVGKERKPLQAMRNRLDW